MKKTRGRIWVEVRSEGAERASQVAAELPCRLGRGPHNTLVLPESSVSWSHAELRLEGQCLVLEDFRSCNGTFVEGKPVRLSCAIRPGQGLRIGSFAIRILELEVSPGEFLAESSVPPSDANAFRVVARGSVTPSIEIIDEVRGAKTTFRNDNRAFGLLVLAKAWIEDGHSGQPHSLRGWLRDHCLASAVWGRLDESKARPRINTLLHRIRADLEAAGLPRTLIQKRARGIRLSVGEVHYVPEDA